jgi:hypothetical protein
MLKNIKRCPFFDEALGTQSVPSARGGLPPILQENIGGPLGYRPIGGADNPIP